MTTSHTSPEVLRMSTTQDLRAGQLADAPPAHDAEAHPNPHSREARAARCDPFARYPEGHERAGETIERQRVCRCGREFTQYQLAPLFYEIAARHGRTAVKALALGAPNDFVPTQCPACESRALGEGRTTEPPSAPAPATQEALPL